MKLKKTDPLMERFRRKRELLVLRNGKFVPKEGTADKTVQPQLRHLPGELVTKEDQDGTKAHELDPAHIVRAVEQEHKQAVRADERGLSPSDRLAQLLRPTDKYMPLTQYNIDFVKYRVQLQLLNRAVEAYDNGKSLDIQATFHLHFPDRDIRDYSLRVGAQPTKWVKKDKHLNDFNLTFRPFGPPPPAVAETMKIYDIETPNVSLYVEKLKRVQELNRLRKTAMDRDIYDRLTKANPNFR